MGQIINIDASPTFRDLSEPPTQAKVNDTHEAMVGLAVRISVGDAAPEDAKRLAGYVLDLEAWALVFDLRPE